MDRIYKPAVLGGGGRANELFYRADVVQETRRFKLIGINIARWPHQASGHILYTQPGHRPQEKPPILKRPGDKVILTTTAILSKSIPEGSVFI